MRCLAVVLGLTAIAVVVAADARPGGMRSPDPKQASRQSVPDPVDAVATRADPEEEGEEGGLPDLGAPGAMYESNWTDANRCPACCAYAAAIRRSGYDTLPEDGAKTRAAGMKHDDRVSRVSYEAMLTVVDHFVYVPTKQRYAPLVYAKAADVLTHAENDLAEKHVIVKGDQKLLDFIHFEMNEVYGDDVEALSARDIMKGRTEADFVRPPGAGICDPNADSGAACPDRMTSLTVLNDRAKDLNERISFAMILCKKVCAKRDVKTAMPMEAQDLGVPTLLEKQRAEEQARHEAEEAEAIREQQALTAQTEKEAQEAQEQEAAHPARDVEPESNNEF
jgi:hypothetical protein